MIGFAAERLMEPEAGAATGAGFGETNPSRLAQRNGEACVQGISTRSVDALVKARGMTGIARSQVRRLCEDRAIVRHWSADNGEGHQGKGPSRPAHRG